MTRKYEGPVTTTDAIVEYNGGIVLIERGKDPDKGMLALPGGFAEKNITLEQNAVKETREETGLAFHIYTPERPLCVKSHPLRDPRGHMSGVTYVGQGSGTIQFGDDAAGAKLYTLDEVQQLLRMHVDAQVFAFDHAEILHTYFAESGNIRR